MNTEKLQDAGATVVIGQQVLPGLERKYETWQENVKAAAADYSEGGDASRPRDRSL
ncbi:hypothetical protein AB0D12_38005 [Streptomyces sp. NPDC048479]|uniref:hypothetical protein n=1 Tax=Streptomyces sp. NPDC048479 TaxID=3154725 RepID=UPI003439B068